MEYIFRTVDKKKVMSILSENDSLKLCKGDLITITKKMFIVLSTHSPIPELTYIYVERY